MNVRSAVACAANTACEVAQGTYFIALPVAERAQGKAVMFLHGWGSSGQGIMRNPSLLQAYLDRGFAVIAPNGSPRENAQGLTWNFLARFGGRRDEIAFLDSVASDAARKFSLDRDKILLTGFSMGGFMTAYSACEAPQNFAAYAPLAGLFWRPHPNNCAGPVRLHVTHGWQDKTVPLEGRIVNRRPITDPDALAQGDIFIALDIWRKTNECVHLVADDFQMTASFWKRSWTRCHPDSALEFALHSGGHTIPAGWVDMTLDWFENGLE